jgi:DNA-binding LacI/PurR family transcriptional regulator
MTGAEEELARLGYHMLLTTLDGRGPDPAVTLAVVQKGRVDGLILAGPKIRTPLIVNLVAANVPLVLVDNYLSRVPVNCILGDDEDGLYQATCHILEHGHREVAFLCGPKAWISNRRREEGFHRAVEEAGIEARVVHAGETTIASGQTMLAEALTRWPNLTALCAVNDPVAIGAVRAAQRLGRIIPDDLAIIGFDDISWAALNNPPLSTVHVYKRRMGQLAARRLVELLQERGTVPSRTTVGINLIIRESCGSHGLLS